MGIPSYFSYIIKNYSNIMRNLETLYNEKVRFHHLYMDCNSIIYDVFHQISKENPQPNLEERIIEGVIQKIEDYIFYIHPSITVYIAFDGVAPFAKMDQQRTRRHKTVLLPSSTTSSTWSTSNITPGTQFMEKLSQRIHTAFYQKEEKYQVQTIIVSTSNDPGEGEHKLFEHMRERSASKNTKNEVCAIYGLDSDLIMLSIFHCRLFKNLYIFREETEFMKTAISLPKPKQYTSSIFCYFMDIDALGKGIVREMKCQFSDEKRIYDYVFLCFFLGNDFLPHFPALNIRTHGIDILLETYRRIVGQYPDRFFIDDHLEIQWK